MAKGAYSLDRQRLEKKETSCFELVSSFLQSIDEQDASINAFIYVDRDGALERAKELDQEIHDGQWRPLTGMVIGVKDLIAVKEMQLSCASKMLEGFESVYTATAIEKLEEAGAIIIGKLNCDEFAMGSSNENSHFGPVRNPANQDYVPGGSSGGSAAAVAAKMCHVAIGSDTGGSIRQPASYCGVVGLKPSYGRVSRMGLVAFASSFDCMGPLANSAEDCGLVLDIMAGQDRWDSSSEDQAYEFKLDDVTPEKLTLGIPTEYFEEGLDPVIRTALESILDKLKAQGFQIQELSLPHTEYGIAAYYILAAAEASSNLARYDGIRYGHKPSANELASFIEESDEKNPLLASYKLARAQGFGDEVKKRIMLGTYVLSAGYYDAFYGKAQKVRTLIKQDFDKAFEEVDILLTPSTPSPAFKLGSFVSDPLQMYLNDVYTVTANLSGIPGLCLPIGQTADSKLPIGLQLLGPRFSENKLLSFGHFLEEKVIGSERELT